MYTIKWSNGESYLQSYKENKLKYIEEQQHEHKQQHQQHEYKQQHEHGQSEELSGQYVFKDSYKEEVSHRVGEREHMHQCCNNPLLGSNFVKDLVVQEQFLIPKNSHFSKKNL